jgi:hypothetical protein
MGGRGTELAPVMAAQRRRIAMSKLKFLALALFLSTGFAALTACEEGPFEEAGEEVDDAADELGDAVD